MEPMFRTPVVLPLAPFRVEYSHPFFMVGSCFTDYIGSHLRHLKLEVTLNPFGVVFNPASIAHSLRRLCSEDLFTAQDLGFNDGLFFSYEAHGSFSDPDRDRCLGGLNRAVEEGHKSLKSAHYLMITLGTAWVYVHQQNGRVVANCHKMPSGTFVRQRLSPDRVTELLQGALETVWEINPDVQVVLSVSPVRHLKDGSHENQISKATLLLAVEALCHNFSRVSYFPAYEIMMDELRDYRFYDADMVHPSALAVDFIRDRFVECYFSPQTIKIMDEVAGILRAREHRPLQRGSESFRGFMEEYARRTALLQERYPFLDLAEERKYFDYL